MTELLIAAAVLAAPSAGTDLQKPMAAICAVRADGAGSPDAARAWDKLAGADIDLLPELLAGMDGASPLACNWLRAAVDSVLERARASGRPLPLGSLEAFVRNLHHEPRARRLAYELVLEADPKAAARLLPDMRNDPSREMRRDAVARLLEEADQKAKDKNAALPLFQEALRCARDKDQVESSARKVRELGQKVDLAQLYGFVADWKVIGPFPNPDQKGYETVYPPEHALDFAAPVDAGAGKLQWKDYYTKAETGMVDLNVALGKTKEGVAYAATQFTSAEDRPAEIRIGCVTMFKLWVNGELALARYDAFTGMRMDHYVAKLRLRKGSNTFLIKSCKDAPPGPLPPLWQFQLRVCDETGAAVLSTTRPDAPREKNP